MVPLEGIIGKPVKIRYGPAAVIGDEPRNVPLPGTQTVSYTHLTLPTTPYV